MQSLPSHPHEIKSCDPLSQKRSPFFYVFPIWQSGHFSLNSKWIKTREQIVSANKIWITTVGSTYQCIPYPPIYMLEGKLNPPYNLLKFPHQTKSKTSSNTMECFLNLFKHKKVKSLHFFYFFCTYHPRSQQCRLLQLMQLIIIFYTVCIISDGRQLFVAKKYQKPNCHSINFECACIYRRYCT